MKYSNLLLCLFMFLASKSVFAQASIDSIRISPSDPVKDDIVHIYLYTSTYHVSYRLYFNQQLNGNTYSIEGCYTMQGSPAATFYADTLTVGPLADDIYKILVTCYRSLDHSQCDYFDTASDSLIFTVLPPASIPNMNAGFIDIHPNPVNGMLHIDLTNNIPIKDAIIYNTYGALMGHYNGKEPINVSAYAPGMYFIHIKTGQGSYSQKFVKQ